LKKICIIQLQIQQDNCCFPLIKHTFILCIFFLGWSSAVRYEPALSVVDSQRIHQRFQTTGTSKLTAIEAVTLMNLLLLKMVANEIFGRNTKIVEFTQDLTQ
jgi:hypothetical protein